MLDSVDSAIDTVDGLVYSLASSALLGWSRTWFAAITVLQRFTRSTMRRPLQQFHISVRTLALWKHSNGHTNAQAPHVGVIMNNKCSGLMLALQRCLRLLLKVVTPFAVTAHRGGASMCVQVLLLLLALLAAHAVAQKCVPGTNEVVAISTAKDAAALAEAIICPGVIVRAVFSGTIQPTDTITVGPKSKLVVVASGASNPAVIDGQGTVQLFNVLAGGELSLQNIVLSNGYALAEGGGILAAADSAITIINSLLEGNVARRGAAIYTDGSVSIQQ
eukprot:10670-Heterococcus_DN1.PRE.1